MTWSPQTEAFQRGDEFVVRADLPGLRAEDVRITVTDDVLSIEGERRETREQREASVYRSEVRYGSFRRSIPLPEGADVDSATACFEDGVLEVSIKHPDGQQRAPRQIEITQGISTPSAGEEPGEEKPESIH